MNTRSAVLATAVLAVAPTWANPSDTRTHQESAAALHGGASPPAEFVTRFQPHDGLRMTTVHRMERSRSMQGQPEVRDETESTTQGRFQRTDEGFEYAPRILASTLRRNGTPVNDPLMALLSQVRPTYVISGQGAVTTIRGFSELAVLVQARMPPEAAAAMAPLVSESALVAREQAEWNARYADFAGYRFGIGQTIDAQAPQKLPTGETLVYTVRTTFARREPCPAGACVRMEQAYDSDAAALARTMSGIVQQVATAAVPPASVPAPVSMSAARVTGKLSRLFDPNTMLIHEERSERMLQFQVQVPGQGRMPVVQKEVRTYSYSYE